MTEWSRKLIDSSGYSGPASRGGIRPAPAPPAGRAARDALPLCTGRAAGARGRPRVRHGPVHPRVERPRRPHRRRGTEPGDARLGLRSPRRRVPRGVRAGDRPRGRGRRRRHLLAVAALDGSAADLRRGRARIAAGRRVRGLRLRLAARDRSEVDEAWTRTSGAAARCAGTAGSSAVSTAGRRATTFSACARASCFPLLPRAPVALDRGGECRPGRRLRLQPRPAGRAR